MDKFWKFMEEKGYGKSWGNYDHLIVGPQKHEIDATKQMLIGFMMEHLDEISPLDHCCNNSTEARYNWLEYKIKSIGEN